MPTLGVPEFRRVPTPEGTTGQFFVQGTVFFVLTQDAEHRFPRVIVDVFHPDQPASGVGSECDASHTKYTLIPETPNGVSPLTYGYTPPQFWEGFQAACQVYFNGLYPGCRIAVNSIYRFDNGEVEITAGIVFSQNNSPNNSSPNHG